MSWQDRSTWNKMIDGRACPMCKDMYRPRNKHSLLVGELGASIVRLPYNQAKPGYVVVILNHHCVELHELTDTMRDAFWADVAQVTRAVMEIGNGRIAKLNTLLMGNLCPHLHVHIVPQIYTDNPKTALEFNPDPPVIMEDSYYRQSVRALKLGIGIL